MAASCVRIATLLTVISPAIEGSHASSPLTKQRPFQIRHRPVERIVRAQQSTSMGCLPQKFWREGVSFSGREARKVRARALERVQREAIIPYANGNRTMRVLTGDDAASAIKEAGAEKFVRILDRDDPLVGELRERAMDMWHELCVDDESFDGMSLRNALTEEGLDISASWDKLAEDDEDERRTIVGLVDSLAPDSESSLSLQDLEALAKEKNVEGEEKNEEALVRELFGVAEKEWAQQERAGLDDGHEDEDWEEDYGYEEDEEIWGGSGSAADRLEEAAIAVLEEVFPTECSPEYQGAVLRGAGYAGFQIPDVMLRGVDREERKYAEFIHRDIDTCSLPRDIENVQSQLDPIRMVFLSVMRRN